MMVREDTNHGTIGQVGKLYSGSVDKKRGQKRISGLRKLTL